jgi:hypothetical protein
MDFARLCFKEEALAIECRRQVVQPIGMPIEFGKEWSANDGRIASLQELQGKALFAVNSHDAID